MSVMQYLDTDLKLMEGLLAKKKAPCMKWQITAEESLCWDSSIHKITFQYKKRHMILQFADRRYKAHVKKYMDEFFDRIQKKIGALYDQ